MTYNATDIPLSDQALTYATAELHADYDLLSEFLADPKRTRVEWHRLWSRSAIAEAAVAELHACVLFHTSPEIRERARFELVRWYEAEHADWVREKATEIDLEIDGEAA